MPVIPIRPVGNVAEAALLRDGWEKKTTLGEPRLTELAENYRSLGWEVHVERYTADGQSCNTCFDAGDELGQIHGVIYARKAQGRAQPEDELF
jgi:hypothetical protein